MNKYFPLILIVGLLLIASCSKKTTGIKWNFLDRNKLDIQQVDFEYFSGKARIDYKDEKTDLKAKANIRIRKDSVIWISFSAVGIQGARCLINQDSITLMNMMKKEYSVFNYDSLSKQFNFEINYATIQAIVLGNLIVPRSKNDDVEKNEDFYLLKQKLGPIAVENYVNPKTMKIEKIQMKEKASKNSAEMKYSDFQMLEKHAFPYSALVSILYSTKKGSLKTVIEFEYSKAEIEDKELKFPFSIPKKYERK
ncbi:DUF4292 domain-containing protein [Fulvivirga sediminis]|uniref:DUF4292 domain-containing protein n=1 Tax=Fulvivirga sediminis TaxID=2803949 RepID=A0A937JXV7_9BACT|nr:DUF4292 domain-containing protein [Fulvivirga sediminis]MBL3655029.1 DUF4292 domain-containing protein [Fulvivirga sediminis]